MIMIAHHRIGTDIDSKDTAQRQQAILDPLAAVFKAFTGKGIFTNKNKTAIN